MVLQQIHILEEMSLASLSQKEQFLVGLLFFSPIDILALNIKNPVAAGSVSTGFLYGILYRSLLI